MLRGFFIDYNFNFARIGLESLRDKTFFYRPKQPCLRSFPVSWRLRTCHRRRIELEDKAKVVASDWGAEFVQFLAALAVLPWSIWKNRMNLTFSFK